MMTESRWQQLSEQIRVLTSRYGSEVGVAAELIVLGLLPGSSSTAQQIRHLSESPYLDHSETSDEVQGILKSLGDDLYVVELIIGLMARPLDGLLGQISQMSQLGTPHQALELVINQALESYLRTTRDDVRSFAHKHEAELKVQRERSDQIQPLGVGVQVGDRGWILKALLVQGSTGMIWLAHSRSGEDGVIKLIHAELCERELFESHFQSQVRALSQVSHPAVVRILDWGQDQMSGRWYIVMPLIEGESLRTRLKRGVIEESEARPLTRALASGLVACHAQQLIHSTIKPEHVMLQRDGSPVLIDFGVTVQDELITPTGSTYATSLSAGDPDPAIDMFALGMMLAESLGPRAGEGIWSEVIGKLTHFMPTKRASAQVLLKMLNEVPHRYHVAVGDQSEGPLRLDDVVSMVLAGQEELHVWWPGASDWSKWDRVIEILIKVEAEREPTIRLMSSESEFVLPPPAPIPTVSEGDRVSHTVGAVVFHERLIPKPDDGHSYWMMETQVTQELYQEITGRNPSKFKGDKRPVERVSWEDGVAFCNALSEHLGLKPAYQGSDNSCQLIEGADGFRLPFESEWGWAASGGQSAKYAGSNHLYEVGWYGAWNRSGNVLRGGGAQEVALLEPNNYGLYDMSGNVWEWCADDYDQPHTHRPNAELRVRRGGSWGNDEEYCQVTHRSSRSPGRRYDDLGLRLCRTAL